MHPARIGLWDRYGGSMESGHIRWIFEQAYPVPYELVYAPALNAGNLKSKFDVLIFPDGGIPPKADVAAAVDAAETLQRYPTACPTNIATRSAA